MCIFFEAGNIAIFDEDEIDMRITRFERMDHSYICYSKDYPTGKGEV